MATLVRPGVHYQFIEFIDPVTDGRRIENQFEADVEAAARAIEQEEDRIFYEQILATPIQPRPVMTTTELSKQHGITKVMKITEAGALIEDSRYRIPELAKLSLDRYANNRFKELKLVTKAFKHSFPFYEKTQQKRSFRKIFDQLKKTVERFVPYVETAKVPFISTGLPSSENIYIRLGPYSNAADAKKVHRYCRYIIFLITKYGLPLNVTSTQREYIKPRNENDRYTYYYSDEEREQNTFGILEIRIQFNSMTGTKGYLLLYYLKYVLQVLLTLHRKAHYVESTIRTIRANRTSNR